MKLPSLWSHRDASDPFQAMRREMDDLFISFSQRWPLADVALKAPAINVAETSDAVEISAELPGVDRNDVKLSIEGNRIVLSGEKKKESKSDDKDWHVVERSYGAFHRSIALPFEPTNEAVSAYFDNGVLHLSVKKPPAAQAATKAIEIKAGAPASKPVSTSQAAPASAGPARTAA